MIIKTTEYTLKLNPYPKNSVAASFWDKWSSISVDERNIFLNMCESMPPALMHGVISTEWEVVSHMPN